MTRRVLGAAAVMLATIAATIVHHAWRPALAAPASLTWRLPDRLDETGLYGADGVTIDPRNRAFSPQYPLWTDGMTKRRWISLPDGAAIDGTAEHDWDFPIGTKLWKEFGLAGRRVETRWLWKVSAGQWLMGSYSWNDDGTEATLAPEEGVAGVAEVANGRRHAIPSRSDCAACHGVARPRPLGFNALQLSTDRDPNAIHADLLEHGMVTVATLVDGGLLRNARADIVSNAPRIRTGDPATRAVLGYLVANCGMCHNGNGEIAAAAPVLRYEELVLDADAVARGLIGRPTRWQVPGAREGESVLLHPSSTDLSAMLARMRSRSPSSQMPPLGTVMRDDQAIEMIVRWVRSLRAS